MMDGQKIQKSLEFKIRTYIPKIERRDQKGLSRVYFNGDIMLEMGLKSGEPCYLWKIDDGQHRSREAIVWQAYQNINKNILQMNKAFQEACGFTYEDRIVVTPSPALQPAHIVVLQDITTTGFLSEWDRPHWEWFLEKRLDSWQELWHGMRYDLSIGESRRSFVLESFKDLEGKLLARTLASVGDKCRVQIVDCVSSESFETPDGPPPSLQVPKIVGIEETLVKLNEFLEDFEFHQAEPSWGRRSCGVILHGASGTGKSLILKKLSETGWGKVFNVKAHTGASGVRDIFNDAVLSSCSIVLIDEFDLLVRRIGEVLLGEEIDRLSTAKLPGGEASPNVVIVATASKLGEIPSSLRKRGRLNTDILIPVPNADARKRILKSLAPPDSPEPLLNLLDRLGDRTYAYTGEDLALLLDKACEIARRRVRNAKYDGLDTKSNLLGEDLDMALLAVRPSAMHDITLQPPKVRWGEIGGQHDIKKALRRAVETPLRYPDLIRRLGATAKKGLLLYGPPGCSKTLCAQAMATEIGFNFFAVKGAELLNMYVGESERAVREIFTRARAASPSIIFFDEIESIGSKRETDNRAIGVNILTTLLNEMDGIEALKGVTVLAATNKPEALDLALLRPGRFDDLLYVAPPDLSARKDILQVWRKRMDWDDDVDIPRLAYLMDGYSGAEIVRICQAACDRVIDKSLDTGDMTIKIHMGDFLKAMEATKKQITPELIEGYRRWAAGL